MIQVQIHRLGDGSILAVKAPNQRDPIIGIGRTGHVVPMRKAKWDAINRVQIAYNRLQHRLSKL